MKEKMIYLLLILFAWIGCKDDQPQPQPPAVADSVVHQTVSVNTTDTTQPPYDYRDKFCGKYAMVSIYEYWLRSSGSTFTTVYDTINITKAKDSSDVLYYKTNSYFLTIFTYSNYFAFGVGPGYGFSNLTHSRFGNGKFIAPDSLFITYFEGINSIYRNLDATGKKIPKIL